ncbi:MAG: hypothetical protein ACJ8EM_03300 [Sphingomicrobium sp.]
MVIPAKAGICLFLCWIAFDTRRVLRDSMNAWQYRKGDPSFRSDDDWRVAQIVRQSAKAAASTDESSTDLGFSDKLLNAEDDENHS